MNIKITPAKVTVKTDVQRIYPELENLEITPTNEEQNYTGAYRNVKVNAVETQKLDITPTLEEQNFNGLYGKINVNPISGETLNITPTSEKQTFNGIYETVNVEGVISNDIETEEIIITPSMETQIKEGLFNKVTVTGDRNLIAENIAKDVTIFGVTGTHEGGGIGEEGDGYNAILNTALFTTGSKAFTVANSITKVKPLDLAGVKSLEGAFQACSELVEIEGLLNTGSVANFYNTFFNCYKLKKIPSVLNTTQATNMNYMFCNCRELEKIPQINTSNCTMMNYIFKGCSLIEEITGIDTSNVKTLSYAFNSCSALKRIVQLNCPNSNSISNMFDNCTALEELGGLIDLGKAFTYSMANAPGGRLNLSYSPNLTHDSLMNVINGLYDLNLTYNVANGGTLKSQQLILGSTNLAKLTSDEIAIATNKGWNVS